MSNVTYGMYILAIGMVVVLTTLYALSLLVKLMRKVLYKPVPSVKAVETVAADLEPDAPEVEEVDDLPTVAVVTAAIAAYLGSSSQSFNVISIRRAQPSEWAAIGRRELLDTSLVKNL